MYGESNHPSTPSTPLVPQHDAKDHLRPSSCLTLHDHLKTVTLRGRSREEERSVFASKRCRSDWLGLGPLPSNMTGRPSDVKAGFGVKLKLSVAPDLQGHPAVDSSRYHIRSDREYCQLTAMRPQAQGLRGGRNDHQNKANVQLGRCGACRHDASQETSCRSPCHIPTLRYFAQEYSVK